jgi:hypothetical protein
VVTQTFTQQASINIPASLLDLPRWLFGMTDSEYQATARGHRALGTWARDGRRGMINVEAMGGNLLVQHYTEESGTPSQVVLDSPRSELYLMYLVRFRVGVRWVMSVTPDGASTSKFQCTVQITIPRWLRVLGTLTATSHSIRAHVDEETHGYARDLAWSTVRQEAAAARAAAIHGR